MDIAGSGLGSSIWSCGDGSGWTAIHRDGSLTPCFVNGIVLVVPSAFLVLLGTLDLVRLSRVEHRNTSTYPWYVWLRYLAVVAKALVLVVTAAFAGLHYGTFDLRSQSPLAVALVLILGLYLHVLESRKALVALDSLLVYWSLSVCASTAKVVNDYATGQFAVDYVTSVLYVFSLVLDALVLFLEYAVPKIIESRRRRDLGIEGLSQFEQNEENEGLLEKADIFSRASLSWMNPLIKQAAAGELEVETLPNIDREFTTERNFDLFESYWEVRRSDSIWSLLQSLFQSFGSLLATTACCEVSANVIGFVNPFLLRYLILFASSYAAEADSKQPLVIGLYICGGMFLGSMAQTMFHVQLLQYCIRCYTCVQSSLMNSIYEKALRLSGKERGQRSTGEIVTLMSVDVVTICNAVFCVTIIWDVPSQLAMCLITLHNILGMSYLGCLAVIAVFMPLNMILTNAINRIQIRQMKYTDERTRLTTEIITNIKSLKLYGWEKPLLARLDEVRNKKQLKNLGYLFIVDSLFDLLWTNVPFWTAVACFGLFAHYNSIPLTSDIVFPCIGIFGMLAGPVAGIPYMISGFIDASVSLKRVRDFLVAGELQQYNTIRLPAATVVGETAVEVKNGTFLFDAASTAEIENEAQAEVQVEAEVSEADAAAAAKTSQSKLALKNVNFTAAKGELSCVVGRVGAGKSSFLQGLLGNLYLDSGSVSIKGSVAYASQQPWLMNGTLKENILFGAKFDPEFYQATIEACALTTDLEILPDGDETEIGERGVSLSGGQKARVSLARAVYARADVYMLDDPLSAVDEHVGRHITQRVLGSNGLLASKTRILVTNAIGVLSRAHSITLLEGKTVAEVGNYAEVMARKQHLYALIREFGRKDESEDSAQSSSQVSGQVSAETSLQGSKQVSRKNSASTLRRASIESIRAASKAKKVSETKKKTEQSKEESEKGTIKVHVYKRYLEACGSFGIAMAILLMFIAPLIELSSNFWLKAWVEENARTGTNNNLTYWLGTYFIIGLCSAVLMFSRHVVASNVCGLRAARILHDKMARQMLRAPMSFFETTPAGRIINRFSSDINQLDGGITNGFVELLRVLTSLIVALSVVIVSAPIIVVVLAPLSLLYYAYQSSYRAASRELKRIMSVARSPIYAHFQESIHGSHTIRAYERLDRFEFDIRRFIDVSIRSIFLFRSVNGWLSFRLQAIGSIVVLFTALIVVLGSSSSAFSPAIIGIIMTYTLQVTQYLNSLVTSIVNVETSVVGVERVLEYCDLESEADEIVEEHRVPESWPDHGHVQFKNYSTRYRAGLDLVLKNIDLDIKSREKIGVVGRTGAGKSSLVMALFRMIEPVEGTIEIDELDISKLGLADLRPNLSIIPQDSQLFEGTLRQNLDPFNNYSDEQVWRVLELSHLKEHVESMPDGLSSTLSEGGSNLSAGQRQLMCLARALISTSSVLVLDEATASVDVQTDSVIQQTIREEFKDRTIVTIAHRINTILDSDRILVLDKGRVAEFDSPKTLLANKDSLFYSLCKDGGFVEED